ncbi:MAG TPA: hypothetical protein VM144_04260 [Aestuariivirga sp.]|nr:hypothetical protein [Aestuariivirga sp.]
MAKFPISKEHLALSKPDVDDTNAKPAGNDFQLKPYRQGAFDGFCGVYSVINAMKLIAKNGDGFGEEFCELLFNALIRHATLKIGARRLIRSGTPHRLMRSFLRGSCDYVSRNRKLKPCVKRPLLRERRLSIDSVIDIMRQEFAAQRCAFIVEIGGVHSHWTVIRGISKAQVQLFDSDGLKVLNISELRMSYEKAVPRAKHWLVAGSIFILTRCKP